MRQIDFRGLCGSAMATLERKLPEILTGLGVGGIVTTAVLAVKATSEAMRQIEAMKEKEHVRKLTTLQTIQATWKCYIPAGVSGVAAAACVIGANTINGRRNAALATVASLAESSLREYRGKVVETIGEKKEAAMQADLDRERVEKNPPPKDLQPPIVPGAVQPVLCCDSLFGRYFYSDKETLLRVQNKLNWQMNNLSEPYISLNEFYMEIGCPELGPVDTGDDIGWRSDWGLIDLRFSSQLVYGRVPCLVMSHNNMPRYGFSEG